LQPDGSYKWTITGSALFSRQTFANHQARKAYINLHTAAYPAARFAELHAGIGSRTFYATADCHLRGQDDHTTDAAAVRFLHQATFGANIADIAALKACPSYEAWIDRSVYANRQHATSASDWQGTLGCQWRSRI
jgi:hypothetical protein